MNKKILTGMSTIVILLSLAGCGTQDNREAVSTTNQSSVPMPNSSNESRNHTSCVGSYSNNDIKTAMRVYNDGTAHYVYYDPENGNTNDSKITWKYLGRNGTAHDQYELNFHDKNIVKPVILTVDNNQIILTSKDKNWSRQTLYRTMTPVDLDEFLSNGGKTDAYEYRGPANATSSDNGSDNTDPAGDGISESEAKQRLQEHGINTKNLLSQRIGNGWEFRTSDMPFGTYKYTVLDDGNVSGEGIHPASQTESTSDSQSNHRTVPSVSSGTPSAKISSSEASSSEMSSADY